MPQSKAQAGKVEILVQSDRLRLRWSWIKSLGGDGRRYVLPLRLPDTPVNRKVAQTKAQIIEQDLATNHFDPTLNKYRVQQSTTRLTVVALFERYMEAKTPHVYKSTLIKYRGLLSHLKKHFRAKPANAIGQVETIVFRDWLTNSEKLEPITVKDKLYLISACWDWAVLEKMCPDNPWLPVVSSFKVPPKQKPKPFTRDEIKMIVQGFRTDPEYCFYGDFVEFFLSIGCRTGEAVALLWKHVSDDCGTVWIGESVTVDGDRKAEKRYRARSLPLPDRLKALLLARRPAKVDPEAPIFSSRRGKIISTRNFAKRAWRTVLEKLSIDYRRPYTSRRTSATISYEYGENPAIVARRLGHDPRTLFRNYLDDGEGYITPPPDLLAD
ncbi:MULTISPECIES: tyrosine-type recombinase/integrase [Leptolyngbya]|uniref:tyrosine-type recombinase/integrase n=1 Tax=Leptolyngbya TaxID=47251 RepID=UPI001686C67C|nr:tyrosine-type recombinase/integrase [Leptolyngbya sp. FACHB-1624]MBD1856992.1 tyrosine-type recombinase/integrase [Leptolyngbya sp. FACHB-1624]